MGGGWGEGRCGLGRRLAGKGCMRMSWFLGSGLVLGKERGVYEID